MLLRSVAARLLLWLKLVVAWAGFYLLRFCERLLPPTGLSLLLWPPGATWDLMQLCPRELLGCWRRFPESWRPARWRFIFRQGFGLPHAQFISSWPDRLCTQRWLGRCRLEGGSDLVGSREGDRGVILATLRFGPSAILPFWLRAHGIAVTTIRGFPDPDPLKKLTSHQYGLSAPADVPVFLPVNEMTPLPRFPHLRRFLGPGRRLLVEVDVDRGIQFHVPFGNRLFRMAAGAIRLAAMSDAELVPCLVVETATWEFAIHCGTPVPRRYLGNSPDLQAAGAHLLGEFSKVVTRYPEQCQMGLLRAILPSSGNGVSDLSAAALTSERG
jgi:lauroyl/myristoyl acyltransferase